MTNQWIKESKIKFHPISIIALFSKMHACQEVRKESLLKVLFWYEDIKTGVQE